MLAAAAVTRAMPTGAANAAQQQQHANAILQGLRDASSPFVSTRFISQMHFHLRFD
jgi:hypothetical protein